VQNASAVGCRPERREKIKEKNRIEYICRWDNKNSTEQRYK